MLLKLDAVRANLDTAGRIVGIATVLGLASCQTSGENGILGSAAKSTKPPSSGSVVGVNPNAKPTLANTTNELSNYCPRIVIRAGTETFRVFPKGKDKTNDDNLAYQATMTKVARECAYVGQNLQMKVGARGRIINGPSGKPGDFAMPIRVAVTVGSDTVYSKLHKPVGSIASGSANGNFSFVDDQVVIEAPSARNVRVFVGFDEGPYNTP